MKRTSRKSASKPPVLPTDLDIGVQGDNITGARFVVTLSYPDARYLTGFRHEQFDISEGQAEKLLQQCVLAIEDVVGTRVRCSNINPVPSVAPVAKDTGLFG